MDKNEIKAAFVFLYENQRHLSLNQIDLVKGLKKYYNRFGTLTERQRGVLSDMVKFLNVG